LKTVTFPQIKSSDWHFFTFSQTTNKHPIIKSQLILPYKLDNLFFRKQKQTKQKLLNIFTYKVITYRVWGNKLSFSFSFPNKTRRNNFFQFSKNKTETIFFRFRKKTIFCFLLIFHWTTVARLSSLGHLRPNNHCQRSKERKK
jgi:hypothetical protein